MFPNLHNLGMIKYFSKEGPDNDIFSLTDVFWRIYTARSYASDISNIESLYVGRRQVSEEDLAWFKAQDVHLISIAVHKSWLAQRQEREAQEQRYARAQERRIRDQAWRATLPTLENGSAENWSGLDWSVAPAGLWDESEW